MRNVKRIALLFLTVIVVCHVNLLQAQTFENYSTIKSRLCSVYKCYEVLNIESDLIKNKIVDYRTKTAIENDKNKEANKKDEDEGNIIIESFKNIFWI